jgi:hypothetical protein
MKAQVYKQEPRVVRIFSHSHLSPLANLPLRDFNQEEADKALKLMNLRRKGKWIETSWGLESDVYFRRISKR